MCEYCPQERLMEAYSKGCGDTYFSLEDFQKCLETVPNKMHIHFTGYVEPFMNPKCDQMMIYAYNKGHKIQTNTTLMGMTKENFDNVSNLKFKNFKIHLPSGSLRERIGTSAKSEKIDDVCYSLTDRWLELLDYVLSKDTPFQKDLHCHGSLHPQLSFLSNRVEVANNIHSRAKNVGELNHDRTEENKTTKANWRGRCGRIYCNVLIPNGDLQLCCNDYGLEATVGNLLRQTYGEIRDSDVFRNIETSGHDLCDYCEQGVSMLDEDYRDTWRVDQNEL
jgi:hypothetical protein